jgi:arginine decarboxylase-like protein
MSDIFIQNFESQHNPNIKSRNIFLNEISVYNIICQANDLKHKGSKERFDKFYQDLPKSFKEKAFLWYEDVSDIEQLSDLEHLQYQICERILSLKKKFNSKEQPALSSLEPTQLEQVFLQICEKILRLRKMGF